MKKIIYSNPDGSVTVLTPASISDLGKVIPSVIGMTEDQLARFIANKDPPPGATSVTIIEGTDLPEDSNRDLWRWDGSTIKVSEITVATITGVKIR